MKQINPKLSSKQKQVMRLLMDHTNKKSEIFYGGGAGGGKSFIGCLWLIINCLQYPGTRYLMGRAKLLTLKQTTLKSFFEVCKQLDLKETVDFKYNQKDNFIKFDNGSEIIIKDLFSFPSDPDFDNLGGLEITAAFVDEANQISEKAKNVITSRIRFKLDENNLMPKLLMTCNPSKNWCYNQFYKKKKEGTLEYYKDFIQSLVTDNPFITKHYIDSLKKMDELSQKRLLYGEWEYEDELGLFKYDCILSLFEDKHNKPLGNDYYMSVDVARLGRDKTCIIVWNGINVVKIIELEKHTLDKQRDIIEEIKVKYGIENYQIAMDADGVGGGLVDMLPGTKSIINNSRPLFGDNYQNLKTQLYFKLAELINNGELKILDISDSQALRLTQELQVIKREKADMDGKIRITPKEEIKKLISRSPDISDSMAFGMYFHLDSLEADYEFLTFEY